MKKRNIMKTKIKNISPDQNIIEHESGLRTVFVETNETSRNCERCAYNEIKQCLFNGRPCDPISRNDKKWGYLKLLQQ